MLAAIVLTTTVLAVAAIASAHGYIVVGSVALTPNPPRPGARMSVSLQLQSTTRATVTGAKVLASLRPANEPTAAPVATMTFTAVPDAGGTYRAATTAPRAGAYTLTFEDHTYPREHATADVSLLIGGSHPNGPLGFAFPPTRRAGLSAWLIWLIAVPVASGIIVWLLVRHSSAGAAEPRAPRRGEGETS